MSAPAPLRVLVVGVGTRGRHWVRLVSEEPQAALAGCVDLLPENLAWARERWGVAPEACFTDLALALHALRPDLVVLATPPMGHLAEARLVFAAGCHLLAEKPLTLDLAEAVEIVRLAEASGRTLTVGLNFRYLPTTLAAKRLIAEELGAPSFGRFIYWRNRDGRRPGINKYPLTMRQPMLWEQSIHHLDLLRYVYDAEVERVWARCHNPPWSMYADAATVTATLEMTGGILATYVGTWSGQTQRNEFDWRTDCPAGSLIQREQFRDLRVVRPGSGVEEPLPLPEIEDFVDDTRAMFADILRQLRAGAARPHPSGIDHLRTLALTAACEESHVTGQPVVPRELAARYGISEEWLG